MKLKDVLLREDGPYTNYHGQSHAIFSSYNTGYKPTPGNRAPDKLTATLDADIERQLIDQAIDLLFNDYPNLMKDKQIRRHHVNMLLGKITSGEVADLIDVDNFIKRLWKNKKIKTR
tara:strand:+ start:2873 stop:3223 length:351 start_codon:yes stop_codon:yes gene_type:complete